MAEEKIVREIKEPFYRVRYSLAKSEKFPKEEIEIDVCITENSIGLEMVTSSKELLKVMKEAVKEAITKKED